MVCVGGGTWVENRVSFPRRILNKNKSRSIFNTFSTSSHLNVQVRRTIAADITGNIVY